MTNPTTTVTAPTSRTADIAASRRRTASATTARRQGLGRAIASEWIKIRTLRSTWIGMALVVLVLVGFGGLAAATSTGSVAGPSDGGGGTDPLSVVLSGANFAVLVISVLGCLAGAREYSSRMIAATVAAVPRRWQVVVSKSIVFGAVTAVTAVTGVLGAFWLGMAILAGGDAATVALTDDDTLRELAGMAGYITAIGTFGLGLGILLRSIAGSIGAVVAGVMILPPLAGALLPASWDEILQYLPSSAGAAFTTVQGAGREVLSPGAGAAVLITWVIAALGGAIISISHRDA
ncbi:ABC transporter permease [Arthrobacter sp. P2b]|uniref:ABC transporter permease n=1 Tax=Arthrobacter sp. P2b TaxID=1938741 RepID=UPI0009C6233F|nr:ABC transporter permease [Arthrobacter sp. P2b]SLJ98613.1 hypothetical protein SAMN06272721_102439 [Arthrobacter sp. P2b]